MAARVERLAVDFGIAGGRGSVLNVTVNYLPIVDGRHREDLKDTLTLPHFVQEDAEAMGRYRDLAARCEQLRSQLEQLSPEEFIEIEGATVPVAKLIRKLWVFMYAPGMYAENMLQLDFVHPRGGEAQRVMVAHSELTQGQTRLLGSIATTVTGFSWKHLRDKFAVSSPRPRPQIFISYRKGHEVFAEALALRVGKEGFTPWYDAWETLAGDSLPGKIEQGLANSVALIAIITADYADGKWATEELESAIHRRIEEDYPIIPVLLENCRKPELIRHLIHVDFTDHNPDNFELKVGEVIDGINRLDRNPFRHQ